MIFMRGHDIHVTVTRHTEHLRAARLTCGTTGLAPFKITWRSDMCDKVCPLWRDIIFDQQLSADTAVTMTGGPNLSSVSLWK